MSSNNNMLLKLMYIQYVNIDICYSKCLLSTDKFAINNVYKCFWVLHPGKLVYLWSCLCNLCMIFTPWTLNSVQVWVTSSATSCCCLFSEYYTCIWIILCVSVWVRVRVCTRDKGFPLGLTYEECRRWAASSPAQCDITLSGADSLAVPHDFGCK